MDIVSSCLVGLSCRYDGTAKPNPKYIKMLEEGKLIPLCPEQLGGLATPRNPAEIVEDEIVTSSGINVTKNYQKGAKESLKIAKLCRAKHAYLKSKSPMCGVGQIYDGTFSGTLTKGDGVFTKQLKDSGIEIISVE